MIHEFNQLSFIFPLFGPLFDFIFNLAFFGQQLCFNVFLIVFSAYLRLGLLFSRLFLISRKENKKRTVLNEITVK